MKTRSNGRIQKCGGKALNYTHVLYENRRKLAWLRLHNRQFNAHDVKRVCKKVSNEIIKCSRIVHRHQYHAIRVCVFGCTPKIMLEIFLFFEKKRGGFINT